MNDIVVECTQDNDDIGEAEIFTFDLIPLVEDEKTAHLDENGLPRIGTIIEPGMIIIGKIGKSARFDPAVRMGSLEIHGGITVDALRKKYGHMWIDRSIYATKATSGRVVDARIVEAGDRITATVVIERS